MEIIVKHEQKYQQFTIELPDEEEAELAYATPAPQVLDFTHTYVPETARGKGLADKLITEALRFAAENEYRVIASCPVVSRFVERHPDYKKLLKQ